MRRGFYSFFILLCFLCVSNVCGAEEIRILALGDSTTAGTPYFRSPSEKPPEGEGDVTGSYPYWLGQADKNYRVFNRGFAAETTSQIFERFKNDADILRPDIVIVLAGVNDMYQGYSIQEIQANLTAIYDFAESKKIRVMACTILPYDRSTPQVKQKITAVNSWIREESKRRNFLFADLFRASGNPQDPARLAGSPDGLHPDKETYRKIAEMIAAVLKD